MVTPPHAPQCDATDIARSNYPDQCGRPESTAPHDEPSNAGFGGSPGSDTSGRGLATLDAALYSPAVWCDPERGPCRACRSPRQAADCRWRAVAPVPARPTPSLL